MIIRIVKLTFKPTEIDTFLSIFEDSKNKIRGFEGCERLELLNDINNPNIYFTYSWWQHPDNLENYRHSDLFKGVWANTKVLFDGKPEAWSTSQEALLK
jgi:heme-degrading monooxygenase HmoA